MLHRPRQGQWVWHSAIGPALYSNHHRRSTKDQNLLDQIGCKEDLPNGRCTGPNWCSRYLQSERFLRSSHEADSEQSVYQHLDIQNRWWVQWQRARQPLGWCDQNHYWASQEEGANHRSNSQETAGGHWKNSSQEGQNGNAQLVQELGWLLWEILPGGWSHRGCAPLLAGLAIDAISLLLHWAKRWLENDWIIRQNRGDLIRQCWMLLPSDKFTINESGHPFKINRRCPI